MWREIHCCTYCREFIYILGEYRNFRELLCGLRPFTLGPVFQSHIDNDWKLFISAGSLVAYMKSLSGLNLTPEGTVMIDSLNKEDKSGMDLLSRSEWISPMGMTMFTSCNLALSDLRVLKWRRMLHSVEAYRG